MNQHNKLLSDPQRVLSQGEKLLKLETHPGELQGILEELCCYALKGKKYAEAAVFAESLLRLASERQVSHRQFIAYNLLGLAALGQGDTATAENCLIAAADCEPIGECILAQELFIRGRSEVVSRFLKQCKPGSSAERRQFQTWIAQIEEGMSPQWNE